MPKKDLTEMSKEIEKVIQKHLGLKEKPAVAIAFTCEPDFDEVHWITNVSRMDGISLFKATANKMISQLQ